MLDIMSSSVSDTTLSPGALTSVLEYKSGEQGVFVLMTSPKQHTENLFLHYIPIKHLFGSVILSLQNFLLCLEISIWGPFFSEYWHRKLLKFATLKYFKNKFWQDCKIRKKDFCINLSFPEMFLITINKAADQGATCKDSLDIDYTVLFFVLWRIILLALLLMFVSVLVYF